MPHNRPVVNRSARRHLLPLLAALLAACSDGGTDQAAAPAPAPAAPAATADACDLLSPEDAEKVVGGIVDEPRGGAPVSSDTIRVTDCTWMEMTSGRTVTIVLRHSDNPDNSPEAIAGVRNELASIGPVSDVEGLADKAFWGGDQLHAFRGGRDYLTVSVAGFPDDEAASAARQAAEIAFGHL
jgi:hypothetical protein